MNALETVKRPSYGKFLEDFREGDVFAHPRGMTIPFALAQEFATTFHDANPLYWNVEYARACGFTDALVPPLLTLNLVLSMGVQNDSEKAIAHLGYRDAVYYRPVYPGDTLRSYTRILSVKPGKGRGVVGLRTCGVNQHGEMVLHYDRSILVPTRVNGTPFSAIRTAWPKPGTIQVHEVPDIAPGDLTGPSTYLEDFEVGEVIIHAAGRTVTDEHFAWTMRLGNTHPLHFDRGHKTSLAGEPVVYGGLVFAWVAGLASRDTTENATGLTGFTEGYHTQPVISGDTLYAVSRVLGRIKDEIRFHLVGLKNLHGSEAIEKFGTELFERENDKRKRGVEKIAQKVFEVEMTYRIRHRC